MSLQHFGICYLVNRLNNEQRYIFPALETPGHFRWISSPKPIPTLGFSISNAHSEFFPPNVFLRIAVLYREMVAAAPWGDLRMFSNGIRHVSTNLQAFILLFGKYVMVLIRGGEYGRAFAIVSEALRLAAVDYPSIKLVYRHADPSSLAISAVPYPMSFDNVSFLKPTADLVSPVIQTVSDQLVSWPWKFANHDIASHRAWVQGRPHPVPDANMFVLTNDVIYRS